MWVCWNAAAFEKALTRWACAPHRQLNERLAAAPALGRPARASVGWAVVPPSSIPVVPHPSTRSGIAVSTTVGIASAAWQAAAGFVMRSVSTTPDPAVRQWTQTTAGEINSVFGDLFAPRIQGGVVDTCFTHTRITFGFAPAWVLKH